MSQSSSGAVPTLKAGRAHPHPEPLSGAPYSAAELMPGNRRMVLLDQRRLPWLEHYLLLSEVDEVANAIRDMVVRGAPAIGIAAAYGMVLAAGTAPKPAAAFAEAMERVAERLSATRPTAVNLAWAVRRMRGVAGEVAEADPVSRVERLAAEARGLHAEDVAACRAMGAFGAKLLADGDTVLTHCNAGALATGGYGTALGVLRAAREAGKRIHVIATETRPYMQGARLTAWELDKDGIQVELVTDSMVGHLLSRGAVNAIVVGADRIARNGDVANKIGTYGIAALAHVHGVPFHVAAPRSTIDLFCPAGSAIPIEERNEREVLSVPGPDGLTRVAPESVGAKNPAFDVTPARLVQAIVTERGVVRAPYEAGLEALFTPRSG